MTPNLPETDDELLIRMRSGDEQAFVALYRGRQAAIYRFALHMSGSATVAEDVAQEVFLALIREECGFDPQRGTLSGYLFGIVLALPRRYREVVVLCDLEEVDYGEAAFVLGCPIGTVRSRLHRARALLLEKLSQRWQHRPGAMALKPIRCLI